MRSKRVFTSVVHYGVGEGGVVVESIGGGTEGVKGRRR